MNRPDLKSILEDEDGGKDIMEFIDLLQSADKYIDYLESQLGGVRLLSLPPFLYIKGKTKMTNAKILKIPESENVINTILDIIGKYAREHEGNIKELLLELTPEQYNLVRVQKDHWRVWNPQKPETLAGVPFKVNYS